MVVFLIKICKQWNKPAPAACQGSYWCATPAPNTTHTLQSTLGCWLCHPPSTNDPCIWDSCRIMSCWLSLYTEYMVGWRYFWHGLGRFGLRCKQGSYVGTHEELWYRRPHWITLLLTTGGFQQGYLLPLAGCSTCYAPCTWGNCTPHLSLFLFCWRFPLAVVACTQCRYPKAATGSSWR